LNTLYVQRSIALVFIYRLFHIPHHYCK